MRDARILYKTNIVGRTVYRFEATQTTLLFVNISLS